MVNKSPDRYGEKTNNSKIKSIDGKNIDFITYKGLPQHINLNSMDVNGIFIKNLCNLAQNIFYYGQHCKHKPDPQRNRKTGL